METKLLDINGVSKVWDKVKGLVKDSEEVLDSKYLSLDGGSMNTTNKVENLNADLLDGYNVGLTNGAIPFFVEFPNNAKLVELGYNTPELQINDEAYLKGICKWCYDTYKNKGVYLVLIGTVNPNSAGTCIIHLYGTAGVDENNNPKYCSGFYPKLDTNIILTFGFNNGIWNYNAFNASNINNAINQIPLKANLSAVYTRDEINDKDFANKTYVDNRFEQLIGAAPADLDTLEELAEKLQDGDDIHTALIQSISEKAPKTDVDALKALTKDYCFNGSVNYENLDTCINNGYYLVKSPDRIGGAAIYNLLLVDKEAENNIRQTYIGVENEASTITYRFLNSNGWSNWTIAKTDGANIKDNSIPHTKLIEGAGSGLDADKLDGYHTTDICGIPVINYNNGCLVRIESQPLTKVGMNHINIKGIRYEAISGIINKVPIDIDLQFYLYLKPDTQQPLIYSASAISKGDTIGDINVFCYNERVYLWFKQPYFSCTFYIKGRCDGSLSNLDITNAAMPTEGVTGLVTVTPKQVAIKDVDTAFNGYVAYSDIDSCTKSGLYLIPSTVNTSGLQAYNFLIVRNAGETSAIPYTQVFYETSQGNLRVLYRSYANNTWTSWTILKLDGSNIADASIPNGKLSGASVAPAANKIPIADSTGMLPVRGISSIGFGAVVTEAGWYRVCEIQHNGVHSNVLLDIFRDHYSKPPEGYNFSISLASYNNRVDITQLSGTFYDKHISKIRVLTKNFDNSYIDVYYTSSNRSSIYACGIGKAAIFKVPTLSNDIPEGYTATEFETTKGFKATEGPLLPTASETSFSNGCLVTTDIDYNSITNDTSIYVEIDGSSPSPKITPVKSILSFYISSGKSIYTSLFNVGHSIGDVYYFINSNGKLCFWFKEQIQYTHWSIYAKLLKSGLNTATSIENKALPSSTDVTNLTKIINVAGLDDTGKIPLSALSDDILEKLVYKSGYDYIDGNLIVTDIKKATNSMTIVDIKGYVYNGGYKMAVNSQLEFYVYNNTHHFINYKLTNFGCPITECKIGFDSDDNVCIWVPTFNQYGSISVFARITHDINNSIYGINRVTKITNYTKEQVANTLSDIVNVTTIFNTVDTTKTWIGTEDEYDAITTKDANTIYYIKE